MNRRWLPGVAVGVAIALLALALPAHPGNAPGYVAMGVSGGVVGAVVVLSYALAPKRLVEPDTAFEQALAGAVERWRTKDRVHLEGLVAEAVGPALAAHALRVSTLCDLLAEQLAIEPEETQDLCLAGMLHVLAQRFGGGTEEELPCAHSPWALASTASLVGSAVCPEAGRMVAESRERWDGTGLPAALIGEEATLGARVLAAVCAFDRASPEGLEAALAVIRAGSATEFDPVVAAELVHLFRQPWQQRQAA